LNVSDIKLAGPFSQQVNSIEKLKVDEEEDHSLLGDAVSKP
jgi:hypothetical protein